MCNDCGHARHQRGHPSYNEFVSIDLPCKHQREKALKLGEVCPECKHELLGVEYAEHPHKADSPACKKWDILEMWKIGRLLRRDKLSGYRCGECYHTIVSENTDQAHGDMIIHVRHKHRDTDEDWTLLERQATARYRDSRSNPSQVTPK